MDDDQSQRMLNAVELGTVLPIYHHNSSSETCVCIRGHFVEYFYDATGNLTDTIDMLPCGTILNIFIRQLYSLKSLKSGTVLLEAKDGKWEGDEGRGYIDIIRIREVLEKEVWQKNIG